MLHKENNFPSLVNESLKIKNVQDSKNEEANLHKFPGDIDGQLFRTLVFTRIIGYKKEMPESGRWKMLTDMR